MDKNNTIHELKLDHHLGETKSPGIMNPSLVNTFKPSLVDDNLDNNKKKRNY